MQTIFDGVTAWPFTLMVCMANVLVAHTARSYNAAVPCTPPMSPRCRFNVGNEYIGGIGLDLRLVAENGLEKVGHQLVFWPLWKGCCSPD
jgi:hypothetical protein